MRRSQRGVRRTSQLENQQAAEEQQGLTAFEAGDDDEDTHRSIHTTGQLVGTSDTEIEDDYRSVYRSAVSTESRYQAEPSDHPMRLAQEKPTSLGQKNSHVLYPEEKIGTAQPIENNSFEPRKRGSGVTNSMLTTRMTADSQGEAAFDDANETITTWVLAQQKQGKQGKQKAESSATALKALGFQQKRGLSSALKLKNTVQELWHSISVNNALGRKKLGVNSISNAREILPSPDLIVRLMTKEISPPKLPEHYNRACSFVTKVPAAAIFFITTNWLQAAAEAGAAACGGSEHFDVEFDHKLRDFKIRGTVFVNDSRAGWNIHIFQLDQARELGQQYPCHNLVEIQRRDGDAFTFGTFYNRLACHLYRSSQIAPKLLSQWGRSPEYYKMYSPWPQEGEFTIEEQFEPDWHGLPDMEQEYKNYGMLNLSRDPSCARIFIGMLKNKYTEIRSQGISSIAKAIRYPRNKAILMQHKGEIMHEIRDILKESRDPLIVRSGLVILREAFHVEITLWEAARFNRADVVHNLLDTGTPVDERDPDLMRTPLMYALEAGHLDIARMLLDAGASTQLRARDGSKASDYAEQSDHAMLNDYSAKESEASQQDTPMAEPSASPVAAELTGEPNCAKRPSEINLFDDGERFKAMSVLVKCVLSKNKWAHPRNSERHPASPCVMTEAVMAMKSIVGIRENFPDNIMHVEKSRGALKRLFSTIESELMGAQGTRPFCEVECSYCRMCKAAYAERNRSQCRVAMPDPCLLQPFQSSYNKLQQLVDAVLTA